MLFPYDLLCWKIETKYKAKHNCKKSDHFRLIPDRKRAKGLKTLAVHDRFSSRAHMGESKSFSALRKMQNCPVTLTLDLWKHTEKNLVLFTLSLVLLIFLTGQVRSTSNDIQARCPNHMFLSWSQNHRSCSTLSQTHDFIYLH